MIAPSTHTRDPHARDRLAVPRPSHLAVGVSSGLVHWQHDSFLARWRDRELRADAYATFWLNYDGSIAQLRLVPSSPLVDFSSDFQDLDLRPVSPDSQATP